MSSFANQAGQLADQLTAAGLPAAAATLIANILGNSVQTLKHSGEIVHDTTPQGLRQVTPESRTQRLTNIDFLEGDPDYRRQAVKNDESRQSPSPYDAVVRSQSPQESQSSLSKTSSGVFTDVSPSGQSAAINLRVKGGGTFPVLDHATNTVLAKTLRVESDGFVRLQLEDRTEEVVIKAGFGPGGTNRGDAQAINIVSDIEISPDLIVFKRKKIFAWVVGEDQDAIIRLVECP